MIIKTITCHDVYNSGASLQAFALQTYLQGKGHDVEIIDYKPDYLSNHYKLSYVPNPQYNRPGLRELYIVAKLPGRLAKKRGVKKKEFDDFRRRYLSLTDRTYRSNGELKQCPPDADLYIAGSDQIWNPLFQNGRDPAFFLDFADGSKRISYAASFSVESLPDDMTDKIRDYLQGLDLITVREKSGQKLVKELGMEAELVCDPVMLVDRDLWMGFVDNRAAVEEPYLFIYDFDDTLIAREVALYLGEKNNCSVRSYFERGFADTVYESGPIGFINSVFHSKIVLSNSLHATIFALLFHKEFYVMKRQEDLSARMIDLLEEMDLSDRVIDDIEDCKSVADIDWSRIDEMIEKKRAYAAHVLDEYIDSCNRSLL